MRLLHTADLHLGKVLHEQSLLEDQIDALGQIAAELETSAYDLFVVAGDVFDRSVPPPEAIVAWDDFLHRVSNACPKLEIVVISGNHDGAVRLGWSSRFLADHHIHVFTKPEDLARPLTLTLGGAEWDIFAVPFLQAGTLGAQAGPEDAPLLRSQRDLWEEALKRLAAARRPRTPSLLVAHLFAQGGTESDSERVFLGEAEQIPAAWLAGWDYVALGHLHQAQHPHPGMRYSGSPLAYSFSESGQEKVLLRWEDGEVTPLPLTPLHPVSRLKGTYEQLCTAAEFAAYSDHWLEITLTDPALVSSPLERLRPRFPRLLSLRQSPAPLEAGVEATARGRQSGDLVGDTLGFLASLGQTGTESLRPLLEAAVQEVLNETA